MRTLLLIALLALTACQKPAGDTKDEKRTSIRTMRDETLVDLYKKRPSAKAKIEASVGYAVFSNFGMKIFVFGSGNGFGMLVDKKGKKDTYMKMLELNTGLGLGGKKFRAVFAFTDAGTMSKFADSGWDFGADAGAGAKSGEDGAEASTAASAQGMEIYVITDTGVELQATIGGTKYSRDDELN